MIERIAEASPRFKARIVGVFYLFTGLIVFDEFFVLGRLVVHDSPAGTAANILAHQLLFRLGFAVQIIASTCNIPLAVIFFDLFRTKGAWKAQPLIGSLCNGLVNHCAAENTCLTSKSWLSVEVLRSGDCVNLTRNHRAHSGRD